MRYLESLIAGLIVYLTLFWFSGPAAIVALPLVAGALVSIFFDPSKASLPTPKTSREDSGKEPGKNHVSSARMRALALWDAIVTGALGALVGLVGGILGTVLLNTQSYVRYVETMPQNTSVDIVPRLLQSTVFKLVLANPVNQFEIPVFIFLATLLTGCFAFSVTLIRRLPDPRFEGYVPAVIVSILCLVMLSTAMRATPDFRGEMATEPADLYYNHDTVIYKKTYYLMADQGFYESYLEAAANDSRVSAEGSVRDGKFYSYILSPLYFRTPTIFYFWRLFTFGNAVGIFYWGLLASVGLLVLSYSAGRELIGQKALLLTAVLVPYLLMGNIWLNLFFPDWWAALALTAGIFFWLRKSFWPSAAAFLAAGAFREITVGFLFLFLLFALLSEKKARVSFGVAVGVFLAVYPFHYLKAAQFIVNSAGSVETITSRLSMTHFMPTSSYLNFPYGFFIWPSYIMMALAVLVWAWRRRFDMLILTLLAFPYFAYASSSYWGQHLMPLIIFSSFMIFAIGPQALADRLKQ